MGKIVMPKNSALLNEVEAVLKIYYDADGWLENSLYKQRLKDIIGDGQYSSSYTKKAQITSYFGFTIWENINNPQSKRKITELGKRMYEALISEDIENIQEVLMYSLEHNTFGRNNYGCPESNSDVEPPALFIRAIIDLGYLTYREFAFLLWQLEDIGANYSDSIKKVCQMRSDGNINIGDEAQKYIDCKPIMVLVRWGFLTEDESDSTGGKHIVLDKKVEQKFISRLKNLKIYNIDMDIIESNQNTNNRMDTVDMSKDSKSICKYESKINSDITNLIVYGTPGCGKSYFVKHTLLKDFNESNIIRTTFYQEYTNTDFVGQIMPYVSGENVTYKFNPGPFALALKQAIQNPNEKIALVIEELNRGNAPSIFGDIFQLLDRENGKSEYHITNVNVQKYLEQEIPEYNFNYIMIPSNLSIIATMNTSDQNVFTLDTAFKRRWDFLKLKNIFKTSGEEAHPYRDYYVPGMIGMKWQTFVDSINEYIIDSATDLQSEDKQLGVFFVSKNMLNSNEDDSSEAKVRTFAYKVLEYLWDDVAKFDRDSWFNSKIRTLDELVDEYIKSGKEVFKDGVFKE